MRTTSISILASLCLSTVLAAGCAAPVEPPEGSNVGTSAQALTASFDVPQIGYWCNAIWPSAGYTLAVGAPGDENANPCSGAGGASIVRTGMYSVDGTNIAEVWCDPGYYWIYEGQGTTPISSAYQAATSTATNGNCLFKITIGSTRRTAPEPQSTFNLPARIRRPLPSANINYTFDPVAFTADLQSRLAAGAPAPIGYQIAVRDPQGQLVRSAPVGTWMKDAPSKAITTGRRFDMASASKTITATAMVAALEDLAARKPGEPAMPVGLDSSIYPFLPKNWTVPTSVRDVTFRMVLEHRSGFCSKGGYGDRYTEVKAMVAAGVLQSAKGMYAYCNGNYALLRVLIPYVVDGPQAYAPHETAALLDNGKLTALSYRSYVRGRLLAPLGISGADVFHTGGGTETLYYTSALTVIPNMLSIPGQGYDMRPNSMVLTAGSGNWTLSAEEMSSFISALWRGKIVSQASLQQMVSATAQSGEDVGIGNFGTDMLLPDGTIRSNVSEAGGGGLGAPVAQWMTLFNGYTVVLLSNTAWGLTPDPFAVVQEAAAAATQKKIRFGVL